MLLHRTFSFVLLFSLVFPGSASGNPTWFVSTPTGRIVSEKELELPVGDGTGLVSELDRLARRDPEPNPVDLSRYQLVGDSGALRLQVGRQSMPIEGLILEETPRQGFSLHIEGGPRKAIISGFVLQTEAELIEGDALGLSNGDNRLGGVAGEISPLTQGAVQLRLKAGYLEGTREGPHSLQQGEAWSMAAEAEIGTKLVLRGEFAGSRYDSGPFWAEQQGRASVLSARYGSVLHRRSGAPVQWHIGVENSTVEPGFRSLGNPHLLSDRERVRVFGAGRRDNVRLVWHVGKERNNLDELSHRPITESTDHSVALYYNHRAPLWWLGTPRHSLIYDGYHRRPIDGDTEEVRYGAIDDTRNRFQYRLDFSRRNWEWGAGYRFIAYEDNLAPWRDSDEQSIDVRAEARIAERIFLSPFAEFGLVQIGEEECQTRRYGLKGRVILIPERLQGVWNAQLSYRELPAHRWEASSSLSGEVVATLMPPRTGRQGLSLSLSGHRRNWERENSQQVKEYGFFLNLRSTLG